MITPNNGVGTQSYTLYGGGSFSFEMPSIGMPHVVATTPPIFPIVNMSVGFLLPLSLPFRLEGSIFLHMFHQCEAKIF
jgi:hypothetical protein